MSGNLEGEAERFHSTQLFRKFLLETRNVTVSFKQFPNALFAISHDSVRNSSSSILGLQNKRIMLSEM
jgi:hypothetical protein